MSFSEKEIEELKKIAPDLSTAQEGSHSYILVRNYKLPEGCIPVVTDLLLCPTPRDGYQSRLFFPQKISGCPPRNWNTQIRVLERSWWAFSWQTAAGYRLAEMFIVHINALRK